MNFQCYHCFNIYSAEKEDMGYEVECPHCHNAVAVPATLFEKGVVFGEFILKHKVATWEKGKIFAAFQTSLQRDVALKILMDVKDRQDIIDFIEEARKDARLDYPHRGQIFMLGEDNGVFYYAIENVETENTNTTIFMKEIVITAPSPHRVEITTQDDISNRDEFVKLTPREKVGEPIEAVNISEASSVISETNINSVTKSVPKEQENVEPTSKPRTATVIAQKPQKPPIKIASKDNRKTKIAFKATKKKMFRK